MKALVNPIKEQLGELPRQPGVYTFTDANDNIIYVGKAKNLRSRVRSYFSTSNQSDFKVHLISTKAANVDYILTDSEQEAFLLENTLIKKNKPRYNVRLKDDKTYPYIKINVDEPWAKVEISRSIKSEGDFGDNARYFGPFSSAGSVRKNLDLLNKIFPFRSCTRVITGKDPQPCLDFHIKRCLGPCIGAVTENEYRSVLDQVVLFLEGNHENVLDKVQTNMTEASNDLRFEQAAFYRDQLKSIEHVMEEQKVVSTELDNEDVIALSHEKDEAWVEVFFVRNGKLVGRNNFALEGTESETTSSIMSSFIKQYYDVSAYIPPRLILQYPLPKSDGLLLNWLENKRGGKVRINVPKQGEKKRLVQLVHKNALEGIRRLKSRKLHNKHSVVDTLEEVKEHLALPKIPLHIECYDISNTQGTNSVGSMVVFENGIPRKTKYRRFKIKTVQGANDFASMEEVLRRRFQRFQSLDTNGSTEEHLEPTGVKQQGPSPNDKTKSWMKEPDLVLIDGGKGQLNAALRVLREMNLTEIPVASIAKREEEIFIPDNSEGIKIPKTSQALFLLQRIRDEAHRFAITYHRQLRSKQNTKSALDTITGIGPKRKKALLRYFGSVDGIRQASNEDIAMVDGLSIKLAKQIKEQL